MPNNRSIAHPGPGHYDNRTGLGYGQTQNKFHKPRPVKSGEYGIYTPKGNWDNEIEQDRLKRKKRRKRKSKKKVKVAAKMSKMTFSSQFRDAVDSLSYRSSDPFSYVGAAGAGHTSLRAHDEKSSDDALLEELLREYISESISASVYVRKSSGDPYPRKNVVSDKAAGQAPSYTRGGSHGHYKRTGNRFAVSGHGLGRTMLPISDEKPVRRKKRKKKRKKPIEKRSTWDILNPDNVDQDVENIKYHQNNIRKMTSK